MLRIGKEFITATPTKHSKLRKVEADTVIKGPLYKQTTVCTFDNPYKNLTEASLWFSLPWPSVLSGFAYWYKDEYVPGVLMDKQKAWFIYTAITSRNEDPGIMVQTSPSSYHAQIYPLAVGWDLRAQLTTVGFMEATPDGYLVPEPNVSQISEAGVPKAHLATFKKKTPRKLVRQPDKSFKVVADIKEGFSVDYYAETFQDGYTYVAGVIRSDMPEEPHWVKGLSEVYWTRPEQGITDGSVKLFIGRQKGKADFHIYRQEKGKSYREAFDGSGDVALRGNDTAKLWAHQKLVQDQWRSRKAVLDFSLKYQIPSTQTALLAVPEEQMKLFREKAAEFERKKKEEERKQRNWQNNRRLNWNRSSGGDPEIRIEFVNATRVTAYFPDQREIELKPKGQNLWGGNFDIPANALEGEYVVRIVAEFADGHKEEKTLSYTVDRTAPEGKFTHQKGILSINTNESVAKAIVVFADQTEEEMVATGDRQFQLPIGDRKIVRVILIDQAHNIANVKWSD
ncbi:MAG: VIT domain-containing protein [Fimbriimonadaceae bacterium]